MDRKDGSDAGKGTKALHLLLLLLRVHPSHASSVANQDQNHASPDPHRDLNRRARNPHVQILRVRNHRDPNRRVRLLIDPTGQCSEELATDKHGSSTD